MLLEIISKIDNVYLQQKINPIPLLQYRYLGSFPSDFVPILPNETFAIINTKPSNMQGEHWTMIANFRRKLYFSHCLGRPSFLKQQYKQMMQQPLQPDPGVCGFYKIYAAFHLFMFRQRKKS